MSCRSAGLSVIAEGNVIVTDQMRIGVEEACSGLSMLVTFLFLSTAVVLVSRRPVWESLCILLERDSHCFGIQCVAAYGHRRAL